MPGPVFEPGGGVDPPHDRGRRPRRHRTCPERPRRSPPAHARYPREWESLEEFYEETISGRDGTHLLACVDEEPIGAVMLIGVDNESGTGGLAYWLLPEFQGEGYGFEALSLLLRTGFRDQRLHRVQADVLETNDASRGLLESLGFVEEGRQREECFVDGHREDFYRYGILASDWLNTES